MSDRATATGPPVAVVVALGAGVLGAIQPKLNAVLGDRVGSALLASLVNFGVAFAAVLVAVAMRPGTRRHLATIRSWPVPRWVLTAGLGGAVIVLAGALAVETIGVAVFSIAFFAGQVVFGLLLDRLGIGPGGVRLLGAARLQAAALAIAAVVLSQAGRPAGEFAPGLVLLVVAAGAAFAFQSAFNGRIVLAIGDPVAATAVNVTVGLVGLIVAVGVAASTGNVAPATWPSEPWLYAGGLLGVTIVLSLAIATASLGVFQTTVAMLAAQLTAALVVDWTVTGNPPQIGALVGCALVLVAASVA